MSAETKENSGTLNWMYKGAAGHVSREEYLLGRKVDASLDLLNQAEHDKPEQPPKSSHVIEYEIVPDRVARRRPEDEDPTATVVQVDMKRKLLDDPLLAIRKREELTRREITDNPVKRKQLELLIRSIKEDSSSSDSSDSDGHKQKKKRKKKTSKKKKSKSKKNKKEKKVKKKKKKRQQESSSSSDDSDSSESENEIDRKESKRDPKRRRKENEKSDQPWNEYNNKRVDEPKRQNNYFRGNYNDERSHHADRSISSSNQRSRVYSPERSGKPVYRRHSPDYRDRNMYDSLARRSSSRRSDNRGRTSAAGGSMDSSKTADDDLDMARKRRHMMEAAQDREQERRDLVRQYEDERLLEEKVERDAQKFLSAHLTTASGSSSVEDRIKSRVGARQRGHDVMTQNFLKK